VPGLSEPVPLRIIALRAQVAELGAAVRQLRKAGLDNAAAELLLSRKRVELDGLLRSDMHVDDGAPRIEK
jgi:hypothetical protein